MAVTGSTTGGALARALRAEWTKLRTVRSTTWASAALVVGTIGFAIARSVIRHGRGTANERHAPLVRR